MIMGWSNTSVTTVKKDESTSTPDFHWSDTPTQQNECVPCAKLQLIWQNTNVLFVGIFKAFDWLR